jgi:hypothetical protein
LEPFYFQVIGKNIQIHWAFSVVSWFLLASRPSKCHIWKNQS